MTEYTSKLQIAVQRIFNCAAAFRETVAIREEVDGKVLWEGEVKVFDLVGHPKAKRCYAWTHPNNKNRTVALLEIPPVTTALAAVKASLVAESKQRQL
jgi:hypothetical protein